MKPNKTKEDLRNEILECKTCNVTKDKLFVYPVSSFDSFTFDNFCLEHKIKVVRLEALTDFAEKIKEEVRKYCNNKDKVIYVNMFLEDVDKILKEMKE